MSVGPMQFESVLHWLPEEDRWALVSWDDWVKFIGIGRAQKVGLPGVNGGVHYFLVCVLDDYGAPANLIPHKYFINPDGTPRADNFGGATKEERETYGTLFLKHERTPEKEKLFNQLAEKMWGSSDVSTSRVRVRTAAYSPQATRARLTRSAVHS